MTSDNAQPTVDWTRPSHDKTTPVSPHHLRLISEDLLVISVRDQDSIDLLADAESELAELIARSEAGEELMLSDLWSLEAILRRVPNVNERLMTVDKFVMLRGGRGDLLNTFPLFSESSPKIIEDYRERREAQLAAAK